MNVATRLQQTSCCGLWEIQVVSSSDSPRQLIGRLWHAPWEVARCFKWIKANQPCVWFLFTEVSKGRHTTTPTGYGRKLADYILEHNLGQIEFQSQPGKNWTNNELTLYLWRVDWPALAEHSEALYKELFQAADEAWMEQQKKIKEAEVASRAQVRGGVTFTWGTTDGPR